MAGPHTQDSTEALEETEPGGSEPRAAGVHEASATESLPRGSQVGRYTVLELIGSGGMGVVYAAFDPELDRRVALKVLHPGSQGSIGSTNGRNRLLREAQSMAKLTHPNVITVHDVGTFGDRVFVAMEFVDGTTLREWLKHEHREWPDIVEVFVRAGRGLAAAHAVGLVHRDFKPDNVLVGHDGRVLVMDFGLARQAGSVAPTVEAALSSGRLVTTGPSSVPEPVLTRTGAVLGTPAYMAPEQHAGGTIGPAVDQFSFCVALFEALYGMRPFSGNSVASLALAVLEGRPRDPPRNTEVPSWLHAVLLRGLGIDPMDRFPSMDALLAELQRDPPQGHRVWISVGVAIGVASSIVGLWLLAQPDPAATCSESAAAFGSLWDDRAREAAHQAFSASAIEDAVTSMAAVDDWMRRWEAGWTASWISACESARARRPIVQTSTARLQCLDGARNEAVVLIERLTHAEAIDVEHAVAAVQSLTPATDCDGVSGPGAADNPRREHIDRELVQARTAVWIGRAREAADRVAPLLHPAAGFEDAGIEGRTFLEHGLAQRALGHATAARTSLRRAILAGAVAGDAALEADAWLALLEQVAQAMDREDDGWSTAVAAEAAIRRAGDDPRARADLLVALGHLQLASGRPGDALERYDTALDLRRAALPPEHLAIAEALLQSGVALDAGDRSRDAELHHAEALAMFERAVGTGHPFVARALLELGAAQYGDGDHGGAQASFARARLLLDPHRHSGIEGLEVPGEVLAPWPPGARPDHGLALAAALDRLGVVARAQRRFDEAAKLHGRAAALIESIRGPNDRRLGYALENLGVALVDLGRPHLALPHLRRALAVWQTSLGDEHPEIAHAHVHLAHACVGARELAEAATHYERALDRWEEQLSADHPLLAYPLTGLGRVRLELGDAQGAVEPLERALELRRDEREDPINVAETSWLLARALAATGAEQERVLELARDAFERVQAALPTDPLELRRILDGGELVGVTDRLVPAGLSLFDRTTAIP